MAVHSEDHVGGRLEHCTRLGFEINQLVGCYIPGLGRAQDAIYVYLDMLIVIDA
jgi:hypothetical protein